MILSFGKHRGKDIEDVPTSYLKWALNSGAIDEDDEVEEVEAELRYRKDHNVHIDED